MGCQSASPLDAWTGAPGGGAPWARAVADTITSSASAARTERSSREKRERMSSPEITSRGSVVEQAGVLGFEVRLVEGAARALQAQPHQQQHHVEHREGEQRDEERDQHLA